MPSLVGSEMCIRDRLQFTSQKTAEFLKGLDMLTSIPKAESFLDGHFVEEVLKERKK